MVFSRVHGYGWHTDPIMQIGPTQWSPLFPLAYYDTPAHSVFVAWFRQLYNIFAFCNLASAYTHVFSTSTVFTVQVIADVRITTGEWSNQRRTLSLSLTHAHSHYFPQGHLLTSCHRVRASWQARRSTEPSTRSGYGPITVCHALWTPTDVSYQRSTDLGNFESIAASVPVVLEGSIL